MSKPLPRHPLSRYAARFSIVAPIAAFWMMCLVLGSLGDSYRTSLGGWLRVFMECLLLALVVGGLVLGGVAFVQARKQQSHETQTLAVLGLTLNLGWVILWITLIAIALLSANP